MPLWEIRSDPDPKKIISDPQHWRLRMLKRKWETWPLIPPWRRVRYMMRAKTMEGRNTWPHTTFSSNSICTQNKENTTRVPMCHWQVVFSIYVHWLGNNIHCFNELFQCFFVSLLHCYIVTLLQCCNVTLLPCCNVTLLHCYTVTLLHCFIVSLFHFFKLRPTCKME